MGVRQIAHGLVMILLSPAAGKLFPTEPGVLETETHTWDMPDDLEHLGVTIGDPTHGRIIALSTSAVFRDPSLFRKYWNTEGSRLDNGLQAHLYTRPEDTFVIQVATGALETAHRLAVAIDTNSTIWRRLLDADLATSTSRVMLVSGDGTRPPNSAGQPPTMTWFPGNMLDALVAAAVEDLAAVLAFVLDDNLLARLSIDISANTDLARRARTVSQLMDKNAAMSLLTSHGIPAARTYTFEASDDPHSIDKLPQNDAARYVFKPACGAAGIGVFMDRGRGAEVQVLAQHVRELEAQRILPSRFQVQEFLAGPVTGASILLDGWGGCRILEIHHQRIDGSARFLGARWTRSEQTVLEDGVEQIGQSLSTILGVPLLLGLDMVKGRVIEINPRLTASAPIAHLLRNASGLEGALGGHRVERIDIDTQVPIAYEAVAAGRVENAVERIRAQYGTLVLPQGLNPFGNTRVAFVNDDRARSARSAFTRLVG